MRKLLDAIFGLCTSLAVVILSIFAYIDTIALIEVNASLKALKAEVEVLKANAPTLESDPGDLPAADLLSQ